MKRLLLVTIAATSLATGATATPARAGGGDVAAGIIGGLAAGTIIGAYELREWAVAPLARSPLMQGSHA
jgi:hypothetical protein